MANPENENKLKNRFLVWVGTLIGPRLLRFLYNTNSWEIEGANHYEKAVKNGKSVIIASWHSTLLTVFMGLSNKNFYGMAGNHHPEAEIISGIGNKLGWQVIRGSSTDGGKKAYNDMLGALKKPGTVFAITPDGPQGPAKRPKAGTIRAAQKTSAVIVPTAGQSTKRWSFKNWDTFYLTKPFGRTVLLFGSPIEFSNTGGFEACSEQLRKALNKLEKEAERRVGMEKTD